MDTFDRHQLDLVLQSEGGPHISVFLPGPQRPFEAKDDAIRVSNLVRHAHATLIEHWMPTSEADDFLKPLEDLGVDTTFLAGRQHGVAIYLSNDAFKVYRMSQRVEERLVISRAFCLRPMISTVEHFSTFFLLTLSKKKVALYSVTPHSISPVQQAGLPESFEESFIEVSADRGAQTHSAARGITGKQGAVFHGQGGIPDAEKAEITEYLRKVDDAACSFAQNQGGFLILAGVQYLTAIYQQINSCSRLVDRTISGNVDHLSADQLLERVMPIAVEEIRQEREADANRIREYRHNPAATDPEQVLCAAYEGRIETLFFDTSATLSGSFHPDTRTLQELHHAPSGEPGDPSHDLIETALVQTLRHGGRVHSVSTAEMPVDAKMAAALRY